VSITQHATAVASSEVTPTQAALVEMWSKILWVPDVSLHDSFIDLGGHSLSATRCINRIRLLFEVEVPLDAFFNDPGDIASIAELIDQARTGTCGART
jgi:acyl carrier protein